MILSNATSQRADPAPAAPLDADEQITQALHAWGEKYNWDFQCIVEELAKRCQTRSPSKQEQEVWQAKDQLARLTAELEQADKNVDWWSKDSARLSAQLEQERQKLSEQSKDYAEDVEHLTAELAEVEAERDKLVEALKSARITYANAEDMRIVEQALGKQ